MTTLQTQLHWEDVKEGDTIPGYTLDLTWTKMVEQVSGSQDFYEVHHDPDFAREAGHEEMRSLSMAIADAGEGTLEIVSDWMDQDIEMDWIKDFVENTDRTLTYAQTSGDPFVTWRYCEENFSNGGKNIRPQFAGRPTGMLFGLESSLHPFVAHPSFRKISNLPLEEKISIMKDPEFKKQLLSESHTFGDSRYLGMVTKLISTFEEQFPMDEIPNYEPPKEESIACIAEAEAVSYTHLTLPTTPYV